MTPHVDDACAVRKGAVVAPFEPQICLSKRISKPTGKPASIPAETQRIPNSTEIGTSPKNGTVPLFPGKASGRAGDAGAKGCSFCTVPTAADSHAESRPASVTSRDPAVTLSPSLQQSLAGSLPPTLHQKSEPMNAKPLQPTVTLDGQPAAGETIIRQLIKELGHCQEQLAACLPDAVGARRTAETGNPASDHFDGATQADDQRAKAGSGGAVHALVSSALQAHDHHLVLLQAESTQLRVQIEQVTARRREFLEFLQTGVARP